MSGGKVGQCQLFFKVVFEVLILIEPLFFHYVRLSRQQHSKNKSARDTRSRFFFLFQFVRGVT